MALKDKNNITISIRNGSWFQNRNTGAYQAADMLYNRFIDTNFKYVFPKQIIEYTLFFSNLEFFWGTGGSGVDVWKPKCKYLNSIYIKSRDIIGLISKGIIHPENGVVDIKDNNVTFETKNTEYFDIILFCTGYKPTKCMTFLDGEIIESLKYKHIFYENDSSLMFVGFVRPFLTSIPMLSELQSRWIAKVISGKKKLPSIAYMNSVTVKDDLKQQKEFSCAYDRLKTVVDPYDYCNMVAYNIDAQVNMLKLLFLNPSLFYIILFGSWNHHVYRLNDEDQDKQQIASNNLRDIFNSKSSRQVTNGSLVLVLMYLTIVVILISIMYTLNKKCNMILKIQNLIKSKQVIKNVSKIKSKIKSKFNRQSF